MSKKQATNNQIMDTLEKINSRFNEIDQRFEGNDQKFEGILKGMERMEQNHVDLLELLQETMVTKDELNIKLGRLDHRLRDYIDRKINTLRGDLVQIGVLKTS